MNNYKELKQILKIFKKIQNIVGEDAIEYVTVKTRPNAIYISYYNDVDYSTGPGLLTAKYGLSSVGNAAGRKVARVYIDNCLVANFYDSISSKNK